MSDYLKGYNKRNRRRRANYQRKRTEKYYNSSNSYRERSRYNKRNRRGPVVAIVVCLVAVVGILFAVSNRGRLTGGSAQVSGVAVSTTVSGSMAEAVASVSTISESAIAAPTLAPRSKAVALTFDDGPSTVNTPKILKLLKKYNAHATFFVLGNRVEKGADLIQQEIDLGCEIANHSWDHSNLSNMSMKKVNKQYDKTAKLIEKLTGYQVSLLRPPYGAISDKMRNKLKHPMIIWSIDTLDWKYRNGKKEFKVVKKNVSDGDIILMHDIHAETSDGLALILPWLIEQDYDILTVSELMERKGIDMKNGTVYASGK